MGDNNSKENGIFMPYDQFGRLCYALAHAKTTMYDSEHTVYDIIRILAAGGDISSTPVLSVNGNTGDVNITANDLGVRQNYYCTCDTDSNISNKVVTCEDISFTLKKGVEIDVLFNNTNTADYMTLNVNNTGDYLAVHNGIADFYEKVYSLSVCKFVYDGEHWRLVGNSVRDETDNSFNSSFKSDSTNFITERSVYYGTPTINGKKDYDADTSIYAPTAIGSSGQILKSNGKNIVWEDFKLPKFKIIYKISAGDSGFASINPNEYNEFLLVVIDSDKNILYSILLPCDYDYQYSNIIGPTDGDINNIVISYGSGMVLIKNLYANYDIDIYAR